MIIMGIIIITMTRINIVIVVVRVIDERIRNGRNVLGFRQGLCSEYQQTSRNVSVSGTLTVAPAALSRLGTEGAIER